MRKARNLICIGIILTVMIVLMAGCSDRGSNLGSDDEFEIKGYMSHALSYEVAHIGRPPEEGFENEKFCNAAAVVTNNTDKLYWLIVLTPVAYDKEGNEIEDAFIDGYFEDDALTEFKKVDPYVVAMNIGAGETVMTEEQFMLAEGIEEPDHIEWKIDKKIEKKTESPTMGLEVTDMSYSGGELSCTVNNNSDNDYSRIDIDVLLLDEDGYLVPGLPIGGEYLDEDTMEPIPVPAHTSFSYYEDLNIWDLKDGLPANAEVYVSVADEE